MRSVVRVLVGVVMLTFALGVDGAWAEAKVTVTGAAKVVIPRDWVVLTHASAMERFVL